MCIHLSIISFIHDFVILFAAELQLHLDLISEGPSNIQNLAGIPQNDFKTLVQSELPSYSGQPSVGPCCQCQRGDPQKDHVTMMGGTLLGSSEQGLYNFEGLYRCVFVEIVRATNFARCSHQGNTVVLDQNCGPDYSTVQLWKPGNDGQNFCKIGFSRYNLKVVYKI